MCGDPVSIYKLLEVTATRFVQFPGALVENAYACSHILTFGEGDVGRSPAT